MNSDREGIAYMSSYNFEMILLLTCPLSVKEVYFVFGDDVFCISVPSLSYSTVK